MLRIRTRGNFVIHPCETEIDSTITRVYAFSIAECHRWNVGEKSTSVFTIKRVRLEKQCKIPHAIQFDKDCIQLGRYFGNGYKSLSTRLEDLAVIHNSTHKIDHEYHVRCDKNYMLGVSHPLHWSPPFHKNPSTRLTSIRSKNIIKTTNWRRRTHFDDTPHTDWLTRIAVFILAINDKTDNRVANRGPDIINRLSSRNVSGTEENRGRKTSERISHLRREQTLFFPLCRLMTPQCAEEIIEDLYLKMCQ